MRIKTKNVIELHDLDELVVKTYGRTYSFQQQDGCKSRGIVEVTIPESHPYDFNRDTVPEVVNGNEMGVSFAAWLARDAKQLIPSDTE
ncbi:MAG: hypothetical protein RR877_10535, partial [Aurantimicrobium sp.]|uniref:hypothetical protein n=1 Tax=Aurantimicrobium sp. TaxID=1930784 RepID=UPI002FCA6388